MIGGGIMTFNDVALIVLVMLGGGIVLAAVILAGTVAVSFLARARPIPEIGEEITQTENPLKRLDGDAN